MENKKHIISLENTEFNWFAFDLDWTLFDINKNINPFTLNKIKNYLKLQVPIIFVICEDEYELQMNLYLITI